MDVLGWVLSYLVDGWIRGNSTGRPGFWVLLFKGTVFPGVGFIGVLSRDGYDAGPRSFSTFPRSPEGVHTGSSYRIFL